MVVHSGVGPPEVSVANAFGRSARRAAIAAYVRRNSGATDPHRVEQPRCVLEQASDSCNAAGDQDDVGDGADEHDGEHVLTAQALPENEGVLSADGDDEGQAEA